MLRAILLCCLFLFFLSASGRAEFTELEEYVAKARAIEKLDLMNEVLHLYTYNQRNEPLSLSIKSSDIFIQERSMISLEIHESEDLNEAYCCLSGDEFLKRMGREFDLYTDFQEPLIYTQVSFGLINDTLDTPSFEVTGLLSFAGNFEGEEMPKSMPFNAVFDVVGQGTEVNSFLRSFTTDKDGYISSNLRPKQPWFLHNETFLDPYQSPLVELGYCNILELEDLVRPLERISADHAWLDEVRSAMKWDTYKIVDRKVKVSLATAELFTNLPYVYPEESIGSLNMNVFIGETDVTDLLESLRKTPKDLGRQVSKKVAGRDTMDLVRMQAYMIRAWSYVLENELNTEYFKQDLDSIPVHPFVKETHLIALFGAARQGEFGKAIAHFENYNKSGPHMLESKLLDELYSTKWVSFGQARDDANNHEGAVIGYFLGTLFSNEPAKQLVLAEKAERMNEPELALYCHKRVLAEQPSNAKFWLNYAFSRSKLGLDPSQDLAIALELDPNGGPLYSCAKASYAIYNTDTLEARKVLNEGLTKWKTAPQIHLLLAQSSSVLSQQKKHFKNVVKYSSNSKGEKFFKKGLVSQEMAKGRNFGISRGKKSKLHKKATKYYKKAADKTYDLSLTYKKTAESYLAMDALEEASEFFGKAIEEKDRNANVFFAQAILSLANNKMDEFRISLDAAERAGIEELLAQRDLELFYFLRALYDLDSLTTLAMEQKRSQSVADPQITALSKDVKDDINRLKRYEGERAAAYAKMTSMIYLSTKGYLERAENKNYKTKNIDTENFVAQMEKSDVDLAFFDKNRVLEAAAEWNKFFKSAYRSIPGKSAGQTLDYLQGNTLFTDSYSYL